MKSTAEVVEYIDEYTRRALERPAMYASSPEALEEALRVLEGLRNYIVVDSRRPDPSANPYHDFLKSRRFGVALFCSRQRQIDPSLTDAKLFAALVEFWRDYLSVQNRPL
jgi:hypothetical protein